MAFYAVEVFGLGYDFLFKSNLGRCDWESMITQKLSLLLTRLGLQDIRMWCSGEGN